MLAAARRYRPAALLISVLAIPAAAFAQTPAGTCENDKAPPAERRAACTTIIDNPGTSAADKADALFYRGDAAGDAGDHDAAIADLTAAIAAKPDNGAAYILRGNSYDARGELDKALADYNEAIRIDPSDATGYFNRAEIHLAKGDKEKAVADYGKALQIDPNHEGAKEGLAEAQKAN